jgi:hypothetical protein
MALCLLFAISILLFPLYSTIYLAYRVLKKYLYIFYSKRLFEKSGGEREKRGGYDYFNAYNIMIQSVQYVIILHKLTAFELYLYIIYNKLNYLILITFCIVFILTNE